MPPLVMKEPQGGILNQTSHLIIKRQMQYGRSEAASRGAFRKPPTTRRDREMTYQYTNFGVPGLGLKRGLGAEHRDRALCHGAGRAVHAARGRATTCDRLRLIGALGRYGYYDAVDFTPQRVPEGDRPRHRLQLHGPPPGHVDRGDRQRRSSKAACATASTAIR